MIRFLWKLKNLLLSILPVKTLGARALVIKDHQVLLVKHTYTPGWCTIGGGVNKGESPVEAVQRELIEEAGIQCQTPPKLFNVYYNTYEKRDDYIVFYIVEKFKPVPRPTSDEIADIQWFSLDNLPFDISKSTLKRIKEYRGSQKIGERW